MYNSQLLSDNIKLCTKNNGINVKTLLSDCELGKNTVGKIANGTDIGIQTIVKIADYLNVSVDYLLGREVQKNAPDSIRSAVINAVNRLPEEKLDRLLGYLEALAQE